VGTTENMYCQYIIFTSPSYNSEPVEQ